MVKLIVTDLDGTLLKKEDIVSDNTVAALKEADAAGIKIAVATGRSYSSSKKIIAQLPIDKYVINVNGGKVYDIVNDSDLVAEKTLSMNEVEKIMNILNDGGYEYFLNHEHGFVASHYNESTKYFQEIVRVNVTISRDFSYIVENDLKIFKFLVITEPKNYDKMQNELFSDLDIYITSSHANNVEIMPRGVNKGAAVEDILKEYGFTWDEVMAFGDNFNDLEMLEKAKYSYAMENAVDKLKEISYGVTLSNADDGVAHQIREYLASVK